MTVKLTPEEQDSIYAATDDVYPYLEIERIIDARVEAERARITANVEEVLADWGVVEKEDCADLLAALADDGDDALRRLQAKAWDEGYKQGGPMHDVNYDRPRCSHAQPLRADPHADVWVQAMSTDLSRYVEPLAEFLAGWAPNDAHPNLVGTLTRQDARALLAPGGVIDRIVTEALAEQRARVEALANEYARMHRVPPYQDGTTVADSILAALDGDAGGES